MSTPIDAAGIVSALFGLGKTLADLANIPFESVMAKLAERTSLELAELDKAAAEQDSHLED